MIVVHFNDCFSLFVFFLFMVLVFISLYVRCALSESRWHELWTVALWAPVQSVERTRAKSGFDAQDSISNASGHMQLLKQTFLSRSPQHWPVRCTPVFFQFYLFSFGFGFDFQDFSVLVSDKLLVIFRLFYDVGERTLL